MIPIVKTEKMKQRVTKKTVLLTALWFVLLAGALTFIAFAGHL